MKKRILSLVLALAMCVSVFSVVAVADDKADLMGELGDTVDNYKDRIWSWQANQFEGMTVDQNAVIEDAWNNYENKKGDIKDIAENLARAFATEDYITLGLADTEAGKEGTLKNLYKWKLMRDIANAYDEYKLDDEEEFKLEVAVTSGEAEFEAWLADFADFEKRNDEAITAAQPTIALGGLGKYSGELTVKFQALADLVNEGTVVIDNEKVNRYVKASFAEQDLVTLTDEEEADFREDLTEDVVELAKNGMFNAFDLGMQIATNKVHAGNTPGLFENISDRDMKAAFLIFGEEFVDYITNNILVIKDKLIDMDKEALINAMIATGSEAKATDLIKADNKNTVAAMYSTMKAAAKYVAEQEFMSEAVGKIGRYYNVEVDVAIDMVVDALEEAMTTIDDKHGLELVHFNRFMGRELLRYNDGGELIKLENAEFVAEDTPSITLGYAHDRYPSIENTLNATGLNLASFDANVDEDGISVYAVDESLLNNPVGNINIVATEEADGTVTVDVYRGYTKELDFDATDFDNEIPVYVELYEEDVYRYVTSFTVTATGTPAEPDTTTLKEIDSFYLSEYTDDKIVVEGDTTLDLVMVTVAYYDEETGKYKTEWAEHVTKAELKAGFNVALSNPKVGKYVVSAGQTDAETSVEFEIKADEVTHTTTLKEIDSFYLSEYADDKIVVKGDTTLDLVMVTVAYYDEETGKYKTEWAEHVTKAELKAGFNVALSSPKVGKYVVSAGQTDAETSVEFEIKADEVTHTTTLEAIDSFYLSEYADDKIVVKGDTTLDLVMVTIAYYDEETGEYKTEWAEHVTKAELKAGFNVALSTPKVGKYVVSAGQTDAETSVEFEIKEDVAVTPDGDLGLTTSRLSIKVGDTKNVTATPNNVKPDGATVVIVWTDEDGKEIAKVQSTAVNDTNNASTATIEKLAKGTEVITATLYVNGVAVASKTVTVKDPSSGGGGGSIYTTITVKVDETKNVVKAPEKATAVEFNGTGTGEVKVELVDGQVVVTGVKEGTVKGAVKLTDENGKTVSTLYYEFVVTEGDVVIPDHKCEWPDIAATATKDAHWAHQTIDTMTINGYIKGYDDGTFKPDQNITRAEFSAIVYRILGLEEAVDGVLYDDTVGHWAEDIIATMSLPEGYGMLRGYGDGNFGPNDLITREQAVAIIARAKSAVWTEAEENAKDIFTDAEEISWWFDGEMDAAVTNGLITGYEDGSYKPLGYTTRAEACVLLARAWPEILE